MVNRKPWLSGGPVRSSTAGATWTVVSSGAVRRNDCMAVSSLHAAVGVKLQHGKEAVETSVTAAHSGAISACVADSPGACASRAWRFAKTVMAPSPQGALEEAKTCGEGALARRAHRDR